MPLAANVIRAIAIRNAVKKRAAAKADAPKGKAKKAAKKD